VDQSLDFKPVKEEGDICSYGEVIAEISGPVRSILSGERTALNFIQRLCGIATISAKCAAEVAGTNTQILDTRKTTPGFRNLEKYAVAIGGSTNHRFGLYDMIMIKDNHRELAVKLSGGRALGIQQAVRAAKNMWPDLKVEVEVDDICDVEEAVNAGADVVMLDNMSDELMAQAVKINNHRAKIEASGGITKERLRSIAETGVDFISIGALTHSVKSADISLDIEV
jgi:nicotinate-nucleotide pyrophosphorylase (carboxylating)